jgi:chromosome segregation ATPase
MIVTEGKLADALRSATAYKKRLKAEKARLDQDHARLNEEMGAAKARCALLEAEVQQLKEQAGLRMKDLQDSDKMLKAGDEIIETSGAPDLMGLIGSVVNRSGGDAPAPANAPSE